MSAIERFYRLLFRLGQHLAVPPFDARVAFADRAERATIDTRLNMALALVKEHSPTRFAYLQRDLPRLLVTNIADAAAMCCHESGMCVLDSECVTRAASSPSSLALSLVHEGTHARIARAGIRYSEEHRGRIERLCFTAEIVVARRLTDGAQHIPHLERWLQAPDGYFSNEAQRGRSLRELEQIGPVARWLARVLRAVTRILGRGAARAA